MKYLKGLLYTLIVSNFVGQTFTNFTSADGLVDDNVTCGTYQGNGILWFGTQNGISKFDGVNWTNFTTFTDSNLISNTITAIKITNNGDLWVGTDFGLCKYADSIWTCFTTADGLGDDRIKYIEQSADGRIWIGNMMDYPFTTGQIGLLIICLTGYLLEEFSISLLTIMMMLG